MPLHMIKLCVGVETVEDLQDYVRDRLEQARRENRPAEQRHPTRVMPKRFEEIVDGGSLFWVIKGQVQVRQRVLRFSPFTDPSGIQRCHIVLQPDFILTQWQPRRPFQGWRYLNADAVPPDLGSASDDAAALPPQMRRELADLGLL